MPRTSKAGRRRWPSCRSPTATTRRGTASGCTAPEYARQLAFWRERLGGQGGERVKRLQAMPTDKPRRAGMSGNGSSQVVAVPKDLTVALRETGLQTGRDLVRHPADRVLRADEPRDRRSAT